MCGKRLPIQITWVHKGYISAKFDKIVKSRKYRNLSYSHYGNYYQINFVIEKKEGENGKIALNFLKNTFITNSIKINLQDWAVR